MIRYTSLVVALLFGAPLGASGLVSDDGRTALGPVQRPVPGPVPDGGTVIMGGLPPIPFAPGR